MTSDSSTCPYCNASIAAPPGTSPGQPVTCRRCGESSPYRGPAIPPSAPQPLQSAPAVVQHPPPPASLAPRPRRSNALVAILLLGFMGLMALVGTWYALQTTPIRRAHDAALPKSKAIDVPWYGRFALAAYMAVLVAALVWGWNRGEVSAEERARPWYRRAWHPLLAALVILTIGTVIFVIPGRRGPSPDAGEGTAGPRRLAPAELPALGYLPPGSNLVAGLHVADALDSPDGRAVLDRLRVANVGAGTVESLTGLKRDDLDHAALGVILDEQLVPRFTLAVLTRQPYEPARVVAALKAGRAAERNGKTLLRFVAEPLGGLECFLWLANPRTLVVSRRIEDFDGVPAEPRAGLDHLPAPVAAYLRTRMAPTASAWAVGHVEDWSKVGSQLLLSLYFKDGWKTFKNVRTFGAGLELADGLRLASSFACSDEPAARALVQYLTPTGAPAAPDADPLARELSRNLRVRQDGLWVEAQSRVPLASLPPPPPPKP